MPPGPAFIPARWPHERLRQEEAVLRYGYVWKPATIGTMAGWVRPRGRLWAEMSAAEIERLRARAYRMTKAELIEELRERKQWLEDIATKGFSLRGGCLALEIERVQEIERLLADDQG